MLLLIRNFLRIYLWEIWSADFRFDEIFRYGYLAERLCGRAWVDLFDRVFISIFCPDIDFRAREVAAWYYRRGEIEASEIEEYQKALFEHHQQYLFANTAVEYKDHPRQLRALARSTRRLRPRHRSRRRRAARRASSSASASDGPAGPARNSVAREGGAR